MTDKIVSEFKQRISAFTLVPSDGGRFEVEVDGELIYSKLQTGSFPDEAEVIDSIRSHA